MMKDKDKVSYEMIPLSMPTPIIYSITGELVNYVNYYEEYKEELKINIDKEPKIINESVKSMGMMKNYFYSAFKMVLNFIPELTYVDRIDLWDFLINTSKKDRRRLLKEKLENVIIEERKKITKK